MKKIRATIVIRSRERLLWLLKDDLNFVINSLNSETDDGSMKFPCKWEPTLWVAASKALDVASIFVGLLCSGDPSEDSLVFTSLSKLISPFWATATAEPLSASWKVNHKSSKVGYFTGHQCCMEPKSNFKF